MGTKKKVGKQRRDKAYWAAKEIGYRSRASFKLIQLNRKWEFLQKSTVCIDLCAAPGSWMQVCRENMPISSLVIGIDLSPIKPIPNCITLQEDITTEKCKQRIKSELKTAKADLVLHDGAPNVGQNWAQDAYSQSILTLSAFKLATVFLAKGGWFVTKVFRSKDYQALLWVFGQFFKKVHATKPAASRNESAEIFVVCQSYLAPDKFDPKFVDPKHVFSDVENIQKVSNKTVEDPRKKKKSRQGYEDGVTMLFKEAKASEFITGDNSIKILNQCNAIKIDKPWIENHKKTTTEIKECLKDLKVLSLKDLRSLKKWKDALKADLDKIADDENEEDIAPVEKTAEEVELEELEEMDREIAELKEEERRKEKRKKKKAKQAQQKLVEKMNLKMIIPGDEGPRAVDDEVFKLKMIREPVELDKVMETEADMVATDSEDDDDPDKKRLKFERYAKDLEDGGATWFKEYDDIIEDSGSDAYESDLEPEPESLGLQSDGEEVEQDDDLEEEEEKAHPLITKLNTDSKEVARQKKAEMWFSKIGDLEDDSDLEDAEIGKAVSKVEDKGAVIKTKEKKVKSGYTSGSEDDDEEALDLPRKKPRKNTEESDLSGEGSEESESDSESESEDEKRKKKKGKKGKNGPHDDDFEIVAQQPKRRKPLTAEQLAIGEELVKSRKRKRDIMDEGWNRYMFNDVDLPGWFYEDEQKHFKAHRELDPAIVQKYKDREREMNVKTIKKVVEAKARKKRKVEKRMEKARKKAAALLDNEDIGAREKAKEIKKMYKAAQNDGKKKEVKYVVSKKSTAGKRIPKQKGPYRLVDRRMKTDTRAKRQNSTKKRASKKRDLKGKQARGSKQYGTQHKHS